MLDKTTNERRDRSTAGSRGHSRAGAWSRRRASAPAAVLIAGETIVDVIDPDERAGRRVRVDDVGDHAVLPGLVDTHVHINEPGRTEWEGFATATRAAAAGGITTLVDMPLNSSPVTTTAAGPRAEDSRRPRASSGSTAASTAASCPASRGQVGRADRRGRAGLQGVPLPLGDRRVSERDRGRPPRGHARAGRGRPAPPGACRADRRRDRVAAPATVDESRSYARHLASRPREWEHDAIRLMIDLCREFRCRVHIVHLSSADALPMIAAARAEGLPLTVETCPHYLDVRRRGDPRRRPALQVCAADQGARKSRTALGGPARRA